MKSQKRANIGFTLIELMIVVAIIGILASIAIPKFANLVTKSKEGSTKGSLGSIRSALSIYYSDMEGQYPSDPQSLTINGKYLTGFPYAKTPNYHTDSSFPTLGSVFIGWEDIGGWLYDSAPIDNTFGSIYVACTHTDTKGTTWTSY
jgi:prepilin-type N-terminal cleavage/methylation domain-containing protein